MHLHRHDHPLNTSTSAASQLLRTQLAVEVVLNLCLLVPLPRLSQESREEGRPERHVARHQVLAERPQDGILHLFAAIQHLREHQPTQLPHLLAHPLTPVLSRLGVIDQHLEDGLDNRDRYQPLKAQLDKKALEWLHVGDGAEWHRSAGHRGHARDLPAQLSTTLAQLLVLLLPHGSGGCMADLAVVGGHDCSDNHDVRLRRRLRGWQLESAANEPEELRCHSEAEHPDQPHHRLQARDHQLRTYHLGHVLPALFIRRDLEHGVANSEQG
mmetsp:Transcript_2796/g.8367  ORF Transcript_2796/g.8367 Transcript_2796/m.8367 type:complete len:270 (+) Transcript_2796:1259-2068(+)